MNNCAFESIGRSNIIEAGTLGLRAVKYPLSGFVGSLVFLGHTAAEYEGGEHSPGQDLEE